MDCRDSPETESHRRPGRVQKDSSAAIPTACVVNCSRETWRDKTTEWHIAGLGATGDNRLCFRERRRIVKVAVVRENRGGVVLNVKVQPRARRTAIVGRTSDALKLAVLAPATDGRANDACIKFLAELLAHPRSLCTIISGPRSRTKAIQITGISACEVRLRLGISDD